MGLSSDQFSPNTIAETTPPRMSMTSPADFVAVDRDEATVAHRLPDVALHLAGDDVVLPVADAWQRRPAGGQRDAERESDRLAGLNVTLEPLVMDVEGEGRPDAGPVLVPGPRLPGHETGEAPVPVEVDAARDPGR